jgi:hypothetical protein
MEAIEATLGTVHTRGLLLDAEADVPAAPSRTAPEPDAELPAAFPAPAPAPTKPETSRRRETTDEELLWTKVALPHEVAYAARAIASRGERRKDLMLTQEIVLGALVRVALETLPPLDVRGLTKYDQDELVTRMCALLDLAEARAA